MGLDVSIYHSTEREVAKAAEEEYERLSEAEWEKYGGYSKSTKEEKEIIKAANKEHAKRLGCTGEYEQHHSISKIEEKSTLYPEHMFTLGYYRSSYNEGGIDRVMKRRNLPDLYEIFKPNDRYEFTPDWNAALAKTEEAIAGYSEALAGIAGDVEIMKVDHNMFTDPNTLPSNEAAALEIVKKAIGKHKDDHPFGGGYSTSEGNFFLGKNSLNVIALIPGVQDSIMAKLYGQGEKKELCFFVAYRVDKKEEKDWYLQALEIVRESIQNVLSKPDPQNYYLHWSS